MRKLALFVAIVAMVLTASAPARANDIGRAIVLGAVAGGFSFMLNELAKSSNGAQQHAVTCPSPWPNLNPPPTGRDYRPVASARDQFGCTHYTQIEVVSLQTGQVIDLLCVQPDGRIFVQHIARRPSWQPAPDPLANWSPLRGKCLSKGAPIPGILTERPVCF